MRARYAIVSLLLATACTRHPASNATSRVAPTSNVAPTSDVAPMSDVVPAHGRAVLLFVSPACPIANRYAPELARIAARFADRARFTLVYPDATDDEIRAHRAAFALTIAATRDPKHALVARAHVEVTPEAALFADGALVWHGRIDDRYADVAHERPSATTHDLEDAVAALVDGRAPPPAHPAVGCAIEPAR